MMNPAFRPAAFEQRKQETREDPVRVSRDPSKAFEIRLWTYGFFEISAKLVSRWGQVFELNDTRLSWEVTQEEKAWNEDEVKW